MTLPVDESELPKLTMSQHVAASYRRRYPHSSKAVGHARRDIVEFAKGCGFSGQALDDIEVAGGENVFRDAMAGYPEVSLEEVMARNPEVIVDMGDMSDTVGVTEEHKRAVIALWNRIPTLAAVKQHRVFAVASDMFVVPGPRVIEAARAFAEMLHPGFTLDLR